MIICESEFARPDSKNPKYAQDEVDIYGYCPPRRDHRLSIRKNLETGKFEAYRSYGDKREEVAYESVTLALVLDFTNSECQKYTGEQGQDVACDHHGSNVSKHCAIAERMRKWEQNIKEKNQCLKQ